MSDRISRLERELLVRLRASEHATGTLATTTAGGYACGGVVYSLRRRRMARMIKSEWRPTPSGGQALAETYALTDRGRAVADNLFHNRGAYLDACGPRQWREIVGALARGPFSASAYRRVFPYPEVEDPASSPAYQAETARLGMAPPRAVLGTDTRQAYDALRARNAALAEGERAAREYGASKYGPGNFSETAIACARAAIAHLDRTHPAIPAYRLSLLAHLIPTDREPLDRAINALASGYAFTEDAHRRLRMLIAARREHDSGDEDDGAIEAAIAECERQLRAAILGNGHLHEPGALEADLRVAALAYAHGWTVSAEDLELAAREPLNLLDARRQTGEKETP